MKPDFLEILDKHNPHSAFMDKKNVCIAMRECYELGKNQGNQEVLDWLKNMNHLSDNLEYLIEEWNNQKNYSNE